MEDRHIYRGETACAAAREPAAAELSRMFAQLSEAALDLSERVETKCSPFTRPEPPMNEGKEGLVESWPPFFNDLRTHYHRLQVALRRIEGTMQRMDA